MRSAHISFHSSRARISAWSTRKENKSHYCRVDSAMRGACGLFTHVQKMLSMSCWMTGLVFSLMTVIVDCSTAVKHGPIRWTDINPLFQENNVIAVNIGDEIDFLCPTQAAGSSPSPRLEYYVIYQVTREEYLGCQVINLGPSRVTKEVINCSKPFEVNRRFRLHFNILSPIGGDFDFRPGSDYFYLTTSTGEPSGIDLRKDGACLEKNMKITIQVGERATTPPPSSSFPLPVTSSTRRTTSTTTRAPSRTTSRTTTTRATSITRPPTRPISRTSSVSTTRWAASATTVHPSTTRAESGATSGVVRDNAASPVQLSCWLLAMCSCCLHLLTLQS